MPTTLIAAFNSEALLAEAVALLREVGYKRSEVRVVSRNDIRSTSLAGSARVVRSTRHE